MFTLPVTKGVMEPEAFDFIQKVIRDRRTCKEFDGRALNDDTLEKLLDLANWAPNHRLNQPWRFKVLTQKGVQKWLDHLRSTWTPEEWEKSQKSRHVYSQAGAIIYVSVQMGDSTVVDWENYAAAAAGVQNILLGATALDILTYWSTGNLASHQESLRFLDIPSTERMVGAIVLGYGTSPSAKPRKSVHDLTRWVRGDNVQ